MYRFQTRFSGGCLVFFHDDVIKWKHFPRYWPFVRGIHRSPVNSPHKGQWRGALMFTLICARINGWVNNGEAGDLRRNRAHYDVIVMSRGFSYEIFLRWIPHDLTDGINIGSGKGWLRNGSQLYLSQRWQRSRMTYDVTSASVTMAW